MLPDFILGVCGGCGLVETEYRYSGLDSKEIMPLYSGSYIIIFNNA